MIKSFIYAIKISELSQGSGANQIKILKIKIGKSNDTNSTMRQYRRSSPDAELMGLWEANPSLKPLDCEKGVHMLAEKYAYKRDSEVFSFIGDDSYKKFEENVNHLLKPINLQKHTEDYALKKIPSFEGSEKVYNQIKNHVATKKHISVPHYKKEDFYPLIIEILKAQNAPLKRKEIVAKVEEQIYDKLSDADKDILKGGNQRWKETLLWAITNLAKQKIIISKSKNQWELNNNK